MPPTTRQAPQDMSPLNMDESLLLTRLLARDSATKTPATRLGEPYRALVNLSLPRRGGNGEVDLVYAGEIVHLTEEEARSFERKGPRDGRIVPVVQKLSGADGSTEERPRLLPRHVSGMMFRPQAPPPNTDLPRPDPAESSRIQVIENVKAQMGGAPEANGSMAVDPAEMESHLSDAVAQDAVDLPPGARTRRR